MYALAFGSTVRNYENVGVGFSAKSIEADNMKLSKNFQQRLERGPLQCSMMASQHKTVFGFITVSFSYKLDKKPPDLKSKHIIDNNLLKTT
jgi:hypothetical protein